MKIFTGFYHCIRRVYVYAYTRYFSRYPFTKVITACLLGGLTHLLMRHIFLPPLARGTMYLFVVAVISMLLDKRLKTRFPIFLFLALFSFGLAFFCLMFMATGSSFLKYLFPLYLLGLGVVLMTDGRFFIMGDKEQKRNYERTF